MTIWEAEEGAIYAGSGSTAGGQTSDMTDSEDLSLEILELLCDRGLGRSEMAGEVRVSMVGGRREGIPLSPYGRCLRLAGWSQCMSCMQAFYAGRPGSTDGGMWWPRVRGCWAMGRTAETAMRANRWQWCQTVEGKSVR